MSNKPDIQEFIHRPTSLIAYQWYPNMELPEWLEDAYKKGDITFTHNPVGVGSMDKPSVRVINKRGNNIGFPGDWICKDQFGLVYIHSLSTFPYRYAKAPRSTFFSISSQWDKFKEFLKSN